MTIGRFVVWHRLARVAVLAGILLAGSRFHREAKIDDDPERMVRDLMGIAKDTDDLDLVRRLAAGHR